MRDLRAVFYISYNYKKICVYANTDHDLLCLWMSLLLSMRGLLTNALEFSAYTWFYQK